VPRHVSKSSGRGHRDERRHARPAGVFVTGTGTEVGKTVVAAAIARTLANEGFKVNVFKPAVTGLEEIDGPIPGEVDPFSAHRPLADHELLRLAAGSGQSDAEIAPYRYQPPVSPHLGAELAGEEIEPARLLAAARAAGTGAERLVCEGVGGLLVPLARRSPPDMREESASPYLVRDLAVDLDLPLVIAASPGLGTINHTLLTIEAARTAGLEVVAVVLTPWPDTPSDVERSNRETIAALGEVEVRALPPLDLDNPDSWPPLQTPTGRFRPK
jgi:dethiobiotin synthetase